MEALMIIGLVALFIVLVFVLVKTWQAVNRYAQEKYDYQPCSIGNTGAMACAIVAVVLSVLVDNDPSDRLNSIVLLVVSGIIATITYIRLIIKTNFLIGTVATLVQAVTGIMAFLIVLKFLAKIADSKKK